MVVVDGHFFQVRSDGSVREVPHNVLSPFAAVTAFSPDQSITVENCPESTTSLSSLIGRIEITEDLQRAIDQFSLIVADL